MAATHSTPKITEAAPGVFHVCGTDVNWTLLADGDALTLIDAGYPRDVSLVEAAIRRVGYRPEALETILVTHAHVDHIGGIPALVKRYGARVLMAEQELGYARGDYVESITPLQVALNSWRYGFLTWGLRIARAGGTAHIRLADANAVPFGEPLDVPGRPVAVPAFGHTSGHTCYYLPEHGAVATGDTLCTGHPTSRQIGPQSLLPIFSHDIDQERHSTATLRDLDADTILPGHGPLHRGPVSDAVDAALS